MSVKLKPGELKQGKLRRHEYKGVLKFREF
jgi:hypothetical protein